MDWKTPVGTIIQDVEGRRREKLKLEGEPIAVPHRSDLLGNLDPTLVCYLRENRWPAQLPPNAFHGRFPLDGKSAWDCFSAVRDEFAAELGEYTEEPFVNAWSAVWQRWPATLSIQCLPDELQSPFELRNRENAQFREHPHLYINTGISLPLSEAENCALANGEEIEIPKSVRPQHTPMMKEHFIRPMTGFRRKLAGFSQLDGGFPKSFRIKHCVDSNTLFKEFDDTVLIVDVTEVDALEVVRITQGRGPGFSQLRVRFIEAIKRDRGDWFELLQDPDPDGLTDFAHMLGSRCGLLVKVLPYEQAS